MVTIAFSRQLLVREVRVGAGMTQRELARRVGVHRSLISRVERGQVESWPSLRERIAGELGVPEPVLFGRTLR